MQQDDIAERLEGIVAELRQVDADHDWLAQYLAADGDAISRMRRPSLPIARRTPWC